MPTKTVTDCSTGITTIVDLTPEEEAEAAVQAAEALVLFTAQNVRDTNGNTRRTKIRNGRDAIRLIVAGTSPLTAANREKLLASAILFLANEVLGDDDATD